MQFKCGLAYYEPRRITVNLRDTLARLCPVNYLQLAPVCLEQCKSSLSGGTKTCIPYYEPNYELNYGYLTGHTFTQLSRSSFRRFGQHNCKDAAFADIAANSNLTVKRF